MKNFNVVFKSAVAVIAFLSMWAFIMHSSIFFGMIGAVCMYTLSIKNNDK